MGAGSNPAALGLLFTWTRGTQLYIQYLDIDMFVCMTGPFTHVTTSINSCSGGTKLNETKIPTNLSLSQPIVHFYIKGKREVGEKSERGGGVKARKRART